MQKRFMRTCAAIRAARDKKKKVKVVKPSPTPKEEEVNVREGSVAVLCNPMLDILVNIDPDYLVDHEIGSTDFIEAEDEKHDQIFEEIHSIKPKPKYVGGGAGLNTARVLQAIVRKPNVTVFFGAIGKDENAGYLQEAIRNCGVNMSLQFVPDAPTATCVVFITGANRALLTKIGAAERLTPSFFEDYTNTEMLSDADFYYITGFFMSIHPEKSLNVMQMAVDKCKVVAFNLSAQHIVMKYHEQMEALMPHIDILFGNEKEIRTYAFTKDWENETLKDIITRIQSLPKTTLRPRMVIVTRGAKPVMVAYDWLFQEYPVKILKRCEIIDENTCGDAFVGGFLSQFIQHMPIQLCIRCGIWAATIMLQRNGCSLKDFPNYKKSCK